MRSLPFTVDRVVMRVSANLADKVRDALRASLNVNEIVDAFLNTYREGTVTRAQAQDWAYLNVKQNNAALQEALDAVWASGWILGTDYATEAMRIASIKKAPTFSIDWSKWKPGQPAAEALVRPPRGLKRLLAKHRNQTIKGISDTNLDRIGTVLADGLAVGADRRSIARDIMTLGIEGIMGDAKRAMTIALTETSRAVGAATLERYQEMGLRFHEWLTVEGEGVCEACDENALAGPIAVGSEFPSGDLSEPAHPNCRCKMIPFIENFSTPVRDTVSLGATADATKGSEDQPRDENGRWTTGGGVGPSTFLDNREALVEKLYTAEHSASRHGDDRLYVYAQEAGHTGLPQLVDSVEELKGTIIYRGIADNTVLGNGKLGPELVEQFKTGELYEGNGVFGNGTYFSVDKEYTDRYTYNPKQVNDVFTQEQIDERTITAALPEDANVKTILANLANEINPGQLEAIVKETRDAVVSWHNDNGIPVDDAKVDSVLKEMRMNDTFHLSNNLTFLGYDALRIQYVNRDNYVVLNRSILSVVK